MTPSTKESQKLSPIDLSGGIFIPLITPRHGSPERARDIVRNQVQRLHHIKGVTGFIVSARETNGVRFDNPDVTFLLHAVKEKLALGKLLIADLGSLSGDAAQKAAGCGNAGSRRKARSTG